MKVNVYRIDTGIVGKVFGMLRKTDVPVAAGMLSLKPVVMAYNDLVNFDNHYVIKDEDELSRFENPLGNSWVPKSQYYIRHPKKARERWLIEAEKFHEFIYREQISEIISFLRANVRLKQLVITSENLIDFSSFVRVPIEQLTVEGKAHVKLLNKKQLEINCPEGLKISEKRKEFVWMNDFQELMAVIDNFEGGEFKHAIELNNSFGISVKEMKTLGIEASWLQNNRFEIRFSCV